MIIDMVVQYNDRLLTLTSRIVLIGINSASACRRYIIAMQSSFCQWLFFPQV